MSENKKTFKEGLKDNIKSFTMALIIAIVFRSFAYEPFKIPSGSMKPTLLVGDFLFVNKFAYGYSKHSLPYSLPLWEGRIMVNSMPKRGDIIVFHSIHNNSVYYIKRIVGIPGDKIQMMNGVLYVNDMPSPKESVGTFSDEELSQIPMYAEKIDQKSFYTLDIDEEGYYDNTKIFAVPEGYYFMVGDNRDGSNDSRADLGMVPFENIIGRADIIFFSISDSIFKVWELHKNIRFKRIFNKL